MKHSAVEIRNRRSGVPAWGDYRQFDSSNGEECDCLHRLCERANLRRWSSSPERNAGAEQNTSSRLNESLFLLFLSLKFTGTVPTKERRRLNQVVKLVVSNTESLNPFYSIYTFSSFMSTFRHIVR